MPVTSPLVKFGLYDLTLNPLSTPTYSGVLQSFSNINDLKTGDSVKANKYITFEPNFWLLDGNYRLGNLPTGIVSTEQSDASGTFASPKTLTITFAAVHTASGLVIHFNEFSNDYCSDLVIAYYDVSNALIVSTHYFPTSWDLSTGLAVSNFKKIIITFNKTNKPYRFLRIDGIDYGKIIYFTTSNIKSAAVVEQIDPSALTLPSNSFELGLFSADDSFNPFNPSGDYANLRSRQPMDVYENLDGDTLYIGRFYLDKWSHKSEREISFSCLDAISLLEDIPFIGNLFGSPNSAVNVVTDLQTQSGLSFDIDPDIQGNNVYGLTPNSSCRVVLQELAFAAMGYATCARANTIQLKKSVVATDLVSMDYTVTDADKGLTQSLKLKNQVTGVEVTAYVYVDDALGVRQVYSASLAAGDYVIKFDDPHWGYSIAGGTITTSKAAYVLIHVTSPGTVTVSAHTYVTSKATYSVYASPLPTGISAKTIAVKNVTIVNVTNGKAVAQHLYNYLQQLYIQGAKLYAPRMSVGDSVLIDSLFGRQVEGIVEKMELDLAGGFTANVDVVGSVV